MQNHGGQGRREPFGIGDFWRQLRRRDEVEFTNERARGVGFAEASVVLEATRRTLSRGPTHAFCFPIMFDAVLTRV